MNVKGTDMPLNLKRAAVVFAAIGIASHAPLPASAASIVYTSESGFLGAIGPTLFTETFSVPDFSFGNDASFSGNGFAFSVSSPGTATPFAGALTSGGIAPIVLTITSGNVTAIGGNFFIAAANNFTSLPVTVTLSDGTSTTYTPASRNEYRGFVSDGPLITSLTMAQAQFPYLDNITLGTALTVSVPEPASLAMLLGALGMLGGAHRLGRRGSSSAAG
jgi:hypothetical protein